MQERHTKLLELVVANNAKTELKEVDWITSHKGCFGYILETIAVDIGYDFFEAP